MGRLKSKQLSALRAVKLFIKSGTVAQRSYIVREDIKLIYLIIYKSACSSIMASMCDMFVEGNYLKIHHKLGKQISQNIDWDAYPGFHRFTFVRDPLQRLVSCYVSKFVNDKKILGQHDLKRLYFDRYLFGALKKDTGFPDFVKRVTRIPSFLADRHFVSQSYLITDRKGRQLVDSIGKFEDLPDAFDPIAQKYGLKPLARYNATGKGNWMDYYDLKSAKMAIDYYANDIKEFGYQESANELIKYLTVKESKANES